MIRDVLAGFAAATLVLAAAPAALAGTDAWTALPSPDNGNGPNIHVIAGSPANPALRFLATQGGVYVSRDAGTSWTKRNSGITPSPAGSLYVTDLALSGATAYITPTFLQKSTDDGASWTRTGWVSENPQALVLAVDPKNPATLYAGSNAGVYKSTDGAATWKYLAGNSPVKALAIDPGNPQVVFRAVSSGLYRSLDGGASWTQVSTQLTDVKTLVVDARNPTTVYAGTNGAGVWKSTDRGSSWKAINRCVPEGRCAPLTLDAVWVRSVIVDPGNPAVVYLGASEGLYKSADGGASWTQANNGPIGVSTMMLDPVNRDTVIGAWGGQLYSYTFGAPSDVDRIFNWAEAAYPQFFAPAGAQTQGVSGYNARYYAGTRVYLGEQGGKVYVHGDVFGGLLFAGTTADLLPLAAAAGY